MSSPAEERIRLVAEAALRAAFPEARVVHELVLRQGGCRVDLAAILPDRIFAVEVKSERDVLDRLERQLQQAGEVCDAVLVVTHLRHIDAVRRISGHLDACLEHEAARQIDGWGRRSMLEATCNAPARLEMLWASELRAVSGAGSKATRAFSIRYAADSMAGRDVRRGVCAALRARVMPRADPPILCDLFPRPTEGVF